MAPDIGTLSAGEDSAALSTEVAGAFYHEREQGSVDIGVRHDGCEQKALALVHEVRDMRLWDWWHVRQCDIVADILFPVTGVMLLRQVSVQDAVLGRGPCHKATCAHVMFRPFLSSQTSPVQ